MGIIRDVVGVVVRGQDMLSYLEFFLNFMFLAFYFSLKKVLAVSVFESY